MNSLFREHTAASPKDLNPFSDTPRSKEYDAIVVGSGPNGLAAAITLSKNNYSVLVLESAPTIGGGMRSKELTLPGFIHDICSAVHPLASSSPFFKSLPLADYGLEWVHPEIPLAHPLEDGRAALLDRSVSKTADSLGKDKGSYLKLMQRITADADKLFFELLGPLRAPRHPIAMLRFGVKAVRSAAGLAQSYFKEDLAKGLFAGNAAHSILPLEDNLTAAVGIMLAVSGHYAGWPVAKSGSQTIANAMAKYLVSLGGEICCNNTVSSLDDLPESRIYLFDTSPKAMAAISASRLPSGFAKRLRAYRYGPGVFKIDFALSDPIPWRSEVCKKASTVHVGGTLEEIVISERAPWKGEHAEKPFVLVAQQSVFDNTRAPNGKHVGWAYCHVPHGSELDMTDAIERQIERFAPGFRDCILERSIMKTRDFQTYNANYVGGDIIGGVQDWKQLFTRPVAKRNPYTTPAKNVFLCSSSTPPGAGVHGMCGYYAAKSALRYLDRTN